MGVPTSEVGYISAMPRREDQKVHKDMWGHWGGKKYIHIIVQNVNNHSPNDTVSHSGKTRVIYLQSLRLSTCKVPREEGTFSRNMVQNWSHKMKTGKEELAILLQSVLLL